MDSDGNIRQSGSAFWAVYRKRPELALADMRHDDADRQKSEVDPSGNHFGIASGPPLKAT
jgi:hypothetical protein